MDLHNIIAEKSIAHFQMLPKSGKPTPTEWTVLSTIVREDPTLATFEVVAMATGSKCIGRSKLSPKGDILNDSHAEVLCRRAFLAYLYEEIELSGFVFNKQIQKFISKDHFHFFTTHMPCGDAAIFAKDSEHVGYCVTPLKRKQSELLVDAKRFKMDIYRTGAKCLPDQIQDLCQDGVDFHQIGAIRTKPGRGDRTLSVSCSDKIAKWSHVGVQGALLSLLLDRPIYFKSFTLAGHTPYSEDALQRAFYNRFCSNTPHRMLIGQATLGFEYRKIDSKNPCPSSIIWGKNCGLEVSVEGKRQGVTKKTLHTKKARLSICKVELFGRFIRIVKSCKVDVSKVDDLQSLSYRDVKCMAGDYKRMWENVRDNVFKIWTIKDPHLLDFYVDS